MFGYVIGLLYCRYDIVGDGLSEKFKMVVNTATLANQNILGVCVLLRYMQVVVWGRVMEINEELAESAIWRFAWITSAALVFGLSYSGKIHHTIEAGFSQNNTMDMSVWACQGNRAMDVL